MSPDPLLSRCIYDPDRIFTMAASADLSQLSDDEVQAMLAKRTEELRKLKEEVAQQDAAKTKAAKAEAAPAPQPAQLSFKEWWPFPIPQRAPSWGIFVLPMYIVYNSKDEMSKLTIATIILCTCISTCVPAVLCRVPLILTRPRPLAHRVSRSRSARAGTLGSSSSSGAKIPSGERRCARTPTRRAKPESTGRSMSPRRRANARKRGPPAGRPRRRSKCASILAQCALLIACTSA